MASASVTDDEDLQESLYERSLSTVWKWVAPATPLGTDTNDPFGPGRTYPGHSVVLPVDTESIQGLLADYLPAKTLTLVTSSTLALMAMKARSLAWGSDD